MLQCLGADFDWWTDPPQVGSSGPFSYRDAYGVLTELEMPLIGHFQRDNAAQAIALAESLSHLGRLIEPSAIRAGLAAVQWPGRLRIVTHEPLTIADGAHNQ